jgi:flavin-dependent dehydrogenase
MQPGVAIIGGGLAGLVSAICLSRRGIPCTVFEKRTYPFHRVCGEYVSNETRPFLQSAGLFPEAYQPPNIHRFQLSAVNGRHAFLPLDLGGFGISRFAFDHFLAQKAREAGAVLLEGCEVQQITFTGNGFTLTTPSGTYTAGVVIGAYGKRARLDVTLGRPFLARRSPYVGVKYHIQTDFPADLIALHNFEGGYCGISRVENGVTNLCYLTHRQVLRTHGSVEALEQKVLSKNPFLKEIFSQSVFLFRKPETINEISFSNREPVFNHVLMVGDTAGLITPLCGNGMAMAIRAAKLVSDLIVCCVTENKGRTWLENAYAQQWKKLFARRLWYGRMVQHYLFGSAHTSQMAVQLALRFSPLARLMVRLSHGQPF